MKRQVNWLKIVKKNNIDILFIKYAYVVVSTKGEINYEKNM